MEYESNVKIIKVDTDDEYEFARDMQVIAFLFYLLLLYFYFVSIFSSFSKLSSPTCCTEIPYQMSGI